MKSTELLANCELRFAIEAMKNRIVALLGVLLLSALISQPSTLLAADDYVTMQGGQLTQSGTGQSAKLETTSTGSGTSKTHKLKTDSGGGGGASGAVTIEDGADETLGAKNDNKSSATDTTSISIVSILKQISYSVQAPPAQVVTGPVTDAQLRATAVPVSLPPTQYTISPSVVTTDGTVTAGKHHIEFVLSTDFAGTIGGAAMNPAILSVYSPGDAPVGTSFAALSYTISAGSAVLTTW